MSMIKVPVELSAVKIAELVSKLREGDVSVVQSIILHYTKFALGIASRIYRKHTGRKEEIEAEALYALSTTISSWIGRSDLIVESHEKLLFRTLYLKVRDYITLNSVIKTTSKHRREKKVVIPLDNLEIVDPKDEFSMIDLLDLINNCIRTKIESAIFTYRSMGLKDEQIANMTSLNVREVRKIRNNLEERFLNYYCELINA